VALKTQDDLYLHTSNANHIEFTKVKSDSAMFTLVQPGNHNYRGHVNHDMQVGFKSSSSRFISAESRRKTDVPEKIPLYKNKCKKTDWWSLGPRIWVHV
jgi:hypothetical protein